MLLFVAAFIPFSIYFLPNFGFDQFVKKLDIYSPFWIFGLQLGLGLLLFIKLFKDFAKWLKTIHPPKSLVFLITSIAVFICLAWIEPAARVQADESIYLSTAQNLYHNQIGIHCVEGTFLENGGLSCVLNSSIKARGISYLYMLGMPFFGKNLHWVYNFQTFILALTLPVFFLAIMAWTKNFPLSLISTALLSSCPILLLLSRSSSPEGLYVFLSALSLLFLKWACDRNTARHWLLLALTLAFFAQTRPETVFCLLAFIGVAFYSMCPVPNLQDFKIRKLFKLSILNFQFSTFLVTLSFFCIPILCTLSAGRSHSLQGGDYSAHGHLIENIIINFKIMAYSTIGGEINLHFMPYFTWLALFGLIILIILTVKELVCKNVVSTLNIPYRFIFGFFILYHIQSAILFDAVSADFNLNVQRRFILVVLPTMSFLGALFLCQAALFLAKIKFLGKINRKIPLFGTVAVILTNLMFNYEYFKAENDLIINPLLIEDKLIRKWLAEDTSKRKLLFYGNSSISIGYGTSAYGYFPVFAFDSLDVKGMIEEYKGEVYFVRGFFCSYGNGSPKMVVGSIGPMCERFDVYFETENILDTAFLRNREISISRITGLTDRDPKNLLRIFYRRELNDTMSIEYMQLRKEPVPWKTQRFVNDSLTAEGNYQYGVETDFYPFSIFKKDTNRIDIRIIDTVTGEQIHSDYWKLLKTR